MRAPPVEREAVVDCVRLAVGVVHVHRHRDLALEIKAEIFKLTQVVLNLGFCMCVKILVS